MVCRRIVAGLVIAWSVDTAGAALTFNPEAGYAAAQVWSGADASHFAVDGDDFFIYGAMEAGGGQSQNVVRWFDGSSTVTIAASSAYSGDSYSADAITALNGDVYWVHAAPYTLGGAATLYKSAHDGAGWNTSTVFDASAGLNVFSLCTDGQRVFGVGLDSGGSNVAFYLDDSEQYQVFAELPTYSGGSGFDAAGNFFAGAADVAFAPHMYRFSADQVADRVTELEATPYGIADALDDHVVPGNGSPVMESDGERLFGVAYNSGFTGTDPYAFDISTGTDWSVGTLAGASTTVTTDMYYRDGAIYLMAKDGWSTGSEAAIYRIVPEPATLVLFAAGMTVVLRRRRRVAAWC